MKSAQSHKAKAVEMLIMFVLFAPVALGGVALIELVNHLIEVRPQ